MYLTQGQFKGRKIEVPESARPTLSKTRQSVFNMLNQFDFLNNTFLDMFSGSGLMSLEAISAGYIATALEKNPKSVQTIKKNYQKLNLKPDVILCDAMKYRSKTFDIIYLDPPWEKEYEEIVKKAHELLNSYGAIVVEHDAQRKINIEEILKNLNLTPEVHKSKKYGRSLIELLIFVKSQNIE